MDTLPITTPRQAGIYVRQAREAQGLTRAALAKTASVSERLLASLELGDATGIRLDKLLTIFNALGLALAAQGDIGDSEKRATSRRPACRSAASQHPQAPSRSTSSSSQPSLVPPFRLLQIPPLHPQLYDEVFADFAMSNLGVSIAANASNQTKPEGK